MSSEEAKKHRGKNNAFTIQLLECTLVAVLICLSYILAGKLIYNNAFPFGWIDGFVMQIIMAALSIIILGVNKYFSFFSKPLAETFFKIISLVIVMNFIFIALLYFSRSIRLSLYYFVVTDTLQILFLILIKRFTYVLKTSIFRNRVTLVVGKKQEENQMLRELRCRTLGKLAFASYEDEKLNEYIDNADNIFVTGTLSKKLKDKIISYCILKDKKVFIMPETYEIAMRKAEMAQVGDIPLFAITSFRLTEAQNVLKRLMDIALSIIGILLTSPIMLYVCIRIKQEDGGPIFYRQIRSGLNGKEFKVIKFRSMVVDAEKDTGAVFAVEDDPRITKIGRRIRTARIDEIPQFFNVLMGSMSIVGPRPERPQFVEEFSSKLPEYRSRLVVKPGITGLAQVMGKYTTSAENKIKFDLIYIRDYSLLLDIKILVKTIKVIFSKSQSKGFSKEESKAFEIEAELLKGEDIFNRVRQPYHNHRLGKAILTLLCAFIIISGTMVLRFSSLTTAMVEAAAQPDIVMIEEEQEVEVSAPIQESTDSFPETTDTAFKAPAKNSNIESVDTNDTVLTVANEASKQPAKEPAHTNKQDKKETEKQNVELQKDIVLSPEQINKAMGKMALREKISIAYELVSRLSAEDIIILDKLARGGLTKQEKAAAKEIMYRYYNESEVQYIKEIYREYVE